MDQYNGIGKSIDKYKGGAQVDIQTDIPNIPKTAKINEDMEEYYVVPSVQYRWDYEKNKPHIPKIKEEFRTGRAIIDYFMFEQTQNRPSRNLCLDATLVTAMTHNVVVILVYMANSPETLAPAEQEYVKVSFDCSIYETDGEARVDYIVGSFSSFIA